MEYHIALFSFVSSIVVAGLICSAIPTSVADITPVEKIMDRQFYIGDHPVGPLVAYLHVLFAFFLIGIGGFATGVALFLFQ
jgi:hypothetical protein